MENYKLCILSNNVDRFIKLNHYVVSILSKEFALINYINYKSNVYIDDINGTKVLNLNSVKELCQYFISNKVIVLNGLNEKINLWIVYLILNLGSAKILRITNISTLNTGKVTNISKVQSYLNQALFLIYIGLIRLRILPCIDVYFTSNYIKHWSNKYKFKNIQLINSIHCDEIIEKKCEITDEYIVFLDSNLPFHIDQLNYGFKMIDPDIYYKKINSALNLLSKKFSKKVVVCAHPKFDMTFSSAYFGNKKVCQYETLKYISMASLVVFHESSAINYALILKKPIVQLDSKYFNEFIKYGINEYKKLLNFKLIDLDNFTDFVYDLDEINDLDKYELFNIHRLCQYSFKSSSVNLIRDVVNKLKK